MELDEIQAMRARLVRAEGTLRITVVGWLVAVVVAAVLWIGAQQAQSQPSTIAARRIAVQDQNGRDRILLSLDANNRPGIWLRDDAGKDRIFIGFGARPGRPYIVLNDGAGRPRLRMGFNPNRGTPQIALDDDKGVTRAVLGFSDAGAATPELGLLDERGNGRIYLGWSTAQKPVVIISDQTGNAVWSAP